MKPGVDPAPVQEKLRAAFRSIQEERIKAFQHSPNAIVTEMFQEKLSLEPASSGRSNMQREYRQALAVVGLLVVLVLLIACANVANLMTAQAAVASARDVAPRRDRRGATASGAVGARREHMAGPSGDRRGAIFAL